MSDHHTPPEVDPKDLARAQDAWESFVQGGKYAAMATAAVLVFLALAFVNFS